MRHCESPFRAVSNFPKFMSMFLRNDSIDQNLCVVSRLPVMCSTKIVEQSKDYFSVYHSPQSGPKIEFLIAFANGQDFSYWYCNRLMACLTLGAEGIFSLYVQHLQTSQHAQCNRKKSFQALWHCTYIKWIVICLEKVWNWSIGGQIIVEMFWSYTGHWSLHKKEIGCSGQWRLLEGDNMKFSHQSWLCWRAWHFQNP